MLLFFPLGIFLIPQALCFIHDSDLDNYSIQCTKDIRYKRFELGYLTERENKI